MPKYEIVDIHVQDISWLIALWLAIHGGDPAPEGPVRIDETTALVAAALSARLTEINGGAVTGAALSERLGTVRVEPGAGQGWNVHVAGQQRTVAFA